MLPPFHAMQNSDADVIRDASGRAVDFGTAPLGPDGSSLPGGQSSDGCLTYDQLCRMVDGLLMDRSLGPMGFPPLAPHPQEATEQHSAAALELPPPAFAGLNLCRTCRQ